MYSRRKWKKRLLKETPLCAQSCGFYWLTGGFFLMLWRYRAISMKLKVLAIILREGERGEGAFMKERLIWEWGQRINKLLWDENIALIKENLFFFVLFSFSCLGRTCSLISPPCYKGGGRGWLDMREPLPRPLASSLRCDILNSFYPK